MPLLLYCICEAQAEVKPPAAGVRGAAVRELVSDGLRCFYSEAGDLGSDAAAVRTDAVDFHAVTHRIFQTSAVIPFRFPSVVKDAAEATAWLRSHAGEYAEALLRLRETVQMEMRISLAEMAAADAASGADYLRGRADVSRKLEQAATSAKEAAKSYVLQWRERPSREGTHCFALVRRSEVHSFEEAMRGLRLEEAVKVMVSGPWPATEFLNTKL